MWQGAQPGRGGAARGRETPDDPDPGPHRAGLDHRGRTGYAAVRPGTRRGGDRGADRCAAGRPEPHAGHRRGPPAGRHRRPPAPGADPPRGGPDGGAGPGRRRHLGHRARPQGRPVQGPGLAGERAVQAAGPVLPGLEPRGARRRRRPGAGREEQAAGPVPAAAAHRGRRPDQHPAGQPGGAQARPGDPRPQPGRRRPARAARPPGQRGDALDGGQPALRHRRDHRRARPARWSGPTRSPS